MLNKQYFSKLLASTNYFCITYLELTLLIISVLWVPVNAALWYWATQKSSFHVLALQFSEVNDVIFIQGILKTCEFFTTYSTSGILCRFDHFCWS